jgi:lysozyme
MKASQGKARYDPRFARFYKRVQQLPKGSQLHAGAYHFLSAADSGAEQARAFLNILQSNGAINSGKLRETDMPPVMDLEWDKATSEGVDRWTPRKAEEIIGTVVEFLEAVREGCGRTPMIYTASAWWKERMAGIDPVRLAAYPMWCADYSKASRASEAPEHVGQSWSIWQFTESATLALGFSQAFDASIFKGTVDQFYSTFGLKPFA